MHVYALHRVPGRRRRPDGGRFCRRDARDVHWVPGDADHRAGLSGDHVRHVGARCGVLATLEDRVAATSARHGVACSSTAACARHGSAQEAGAVTSRPPGPSSSRTQLFVVSCSSSCVSRAPWKPGRFS